MSSLQPWFKILCSGQFSCTPFPNRNSKMMPIHKSNAPWIPNLNRKCSLIQKFWAPEMRNFASLSKFRDFYWSFSKIKEKRFLIFNQKPMKPIFETEWNPIFIFTGKHCPYKFNKELKFHCLLDILFSECPLPRRPFLVDILLLFYSMRNENLLGHNGSYQPSFQYWKISGRNASDATDFYDFETLSQKTGKRQ